MCVSAFTPVKFIMTESLFMELLFYLYFIAIVVSGLNKKNGKIEL
jgi:hypothetical protein